MRPIDLPHQTPQALLQRAATMIETAMNALHERPGRCACCERISYGNFQAHLARESLLPLPGKLRRIAAINAAFTDEQPALASSSHP